MSPRMCRRVWSKLPDVLLERILPLLPVSSLLRFRCVCKSWNSFILSPSFFQQCSDICGYGYAGKPSRARLLRSDSDDDVSYLLLSTWSHEFPLLAFSPSRGTWHRPSLNFLDADEMEFSLVSASGGLVCLSDGEGTFLVCNPITKAKRRITLACSETGEALMWNIISTNFRAFQEEGISRFELICVGSCKDCKQATCVYDYSKNQWMIYRDYREIHFFEGNGTFHGPDLMTITSFPFKLMIFYKASGTWREHGASLPSHVLFPCLVENSGSLMLLAAVDGADEERKSLGWREDEYLCSAPPENDTGVESESKIKAFKLWRLDEERNSWIEVASVPDEMLANILKSGCFEGFSCAAQKEMVYLNSSEGCIVYDVSFGTWRWLPQAQVLVELHACIKDLYAFEPTLNSLLVCKPPSPSSSSILSPSLSLCSKSYSSSLWPLPPSSLSC